MKIKTGASVKISKEKESEMQSLANLTATFERTFKGKELKDFVHWYLKNTGQGHLTEFWNLYTIVALRDLSEVGWKVNEVINHAKEKARL